MKRLTVKQQKFIGEYLISGNGAQAAIRAGYSEANADRAIALFGLSIPLWMDLPIDNTKSYGGFEPKRSRSTHA